MRQKLTIALLFAGIFLSGVTLILGATSAWLVGIAGFFFVIGGTLLTALISEGFEKVDDLMRRLPTVFSENEPALGADEETFLDVATCYRRGSVRQAEMRIKTIEDPYLHLGAQLVIDRCSRKELDRALLWHASSTREQERRRLRILHGMTSFAPAFGMLGTLLGLVRLLFSLGDSGLDVVGSAMGFAMITTVYGLVVANLFIKPMAIKMEQRLREKQAWQQVKHELLLLLLEKQHPAVIKETLNAFVTGRPMDLPPSTVTEVTLANV